MLIYYIYNKDQLGASAKINNTWKFICTVPNDLTVFGHRRKFLIVHDAHIDNSRKYTTPKIRGWAIMNFNVHYKKLLCLLSTSYNNFSYHNLLKVIIFIIMFSSCMNSYYVRHEQISYQKKKKINF